MTDIFIPLAKFNFALLHADTYTRIKNNEKMICHMSALSYIDIITVADTSSLGFFKAYKK